MTSVCLLLLIFTAICAEISWEEYKEKYELNFENDDESLRKQIFEKNVKIIEAENAMNYSYKLAINHFAHWTKKEIESMFMTPKHNNDVEDQETLFEELSGDGREMPSEDVINAGLDVDWRRNGYVTRVKDQGKCGSCYAFGSTANLESARAMRTKVSLDLSAQQVLDCSRNNGCKGGNEYYSYVYLKSFGAMSWNSYRYRAKKEKCRHKQSSVVAKIGYFKLIDDRSDKGLTESISKRPTTVRLHANLHSFMFYSSGIYDDPSCSPKKLGHVSIMVGVVQTKGSNYYILKNSWGYCWGMKGYMHLGKNRKNPCGVASYPSYVVMS